MPQLALGLYAGFVAIAFGWRTWQRWRATGDTGFRGFSRHAGGVERSAGVLFALAAIALAVGPISMIQHRSLPLLDAEDPSLIALGVVLALVGFGLTLRAQGQMGASWRVGVDPEEATELVAHGLFARVRNPIFTALLVGALGIVCLAPNAVSVAAWLALLVATELQVRCVEEPHLLKTHGEAYRAYARRTGRFVPSLGRLR